MFGQHIYVQCGSLLGTAENLTNLWRARICKISRQKCRICKFLRQNFVFVNFCNKNVTFSNTRYPKIPDYSENISGRVRVLLKIIGSGRVSGTRQSLEAYMQTLHLSLLCALLIYETMYLAYLRSFNCNRHGTR